MRKHFLLLLWLTMLPLALWAQTITISPNHAFTMTYGDATPAVTNRSWVTMTASGGGTGYTGTYGANNHFNGNNDLKDQLLARLSIAQDYSTYDAGTYNYTLTHSGNEQFTFSYGGNNYTYTIVHTNGTGTRTMTIDRANNAITSVSLDNWAFGETPKTPSVTATNTDGAISYEYYNGGWSSTVPTAVGDYQVRATIAQSTNYKAVTSSGYAFKITKAAVTVTLGNVTREWQSPWTPLTVDDITPVVTGGTTDWDLVKGYLKWNQVEPIGNAGDQYAYTLDPNGTSPNYDITVSGTGAVVIEKNATGTLGSAGDNLTALTYNGTPLELAPTSVPSFEDSKGNNAGTIEYKLSTETEWSATPPTATLAGDYVVEFRGVGDQNHTDAASTGSYNVKINRRPITTADYKLPEAIEGLEYDGDQHDLHTALEWTDGIERGTVEYWRNDQANWVTNIRWRDVAGNWTIQTRITPDANHIINGGTAAYVVQTEFPVTIAKADPEVDAVGAVYTDLVYTGSPQGLVESAPTFKGIAAGGTSQAVPGNITYYWNDGTTDRTATNIANVLATNKGDYPITFTFTPTGAVGNNFNSIVIANALDLGTAKIAQADNEITTNPVAKTGLVFDATAKKLIDTEGVAKFGDVVYSLEEDGTYGPATDIEGTDAGEYTIYYKVVETDDYEGVDPLSFTATIEKATLNFGVSSLTVDWADGTTYEWAYIVDQLVTSDDWLAGETDAQKADIMFAALNITVNGGAADASNEDFVALLAGDAGVYNIALTANDDAEGVNYKIKLYNDATNVTINKIDASLAVLADAGKTYNGDPQDLVTITTAAVGAAAENGVLYIVGGDTAPEADAEGWTAGIPQETDANTYNVWQKVVGDKNHNDVVATAAVVGTIAPKNIADAVFTIDPASSAYTGENQNETVIAVDPDDAEPMDVEKDIKSITLPADVTSFGEYDVTIEGQGNYTGTTTKKFNITQAENNATVTIAGWTYGEYDEEVNAPQTTADFGVETVKYTYSVKDANDWKDEVPTEFGTYTVKATIAETADYAAAEATADFDIAKADVTDIVKPASINETYDLTYNGADLALVKAATFEDGIEKGTFKYFVGETAPAADSEDWSEDIPVAKDAGEYIVKTLFTPDDNHNPATVEDVTVTIHKAEISYVLGNVTKEWDGAPLDEDQINSLFAINNGELFGVDKYEVPFYFILPEEYKDANEEGYTFTQVDYKFKTIEDGYDKDYPENYDVKFTGTAKIVITKKNITAADFTAPEAIPGLEYNGQVQTLVTTGEVTTTYLWDGDEKAKPIGTIKFASTLDGEFKAFEDAADVVKGTDKGGYTVYYMVEGDKNHNDFVATEATLIADVEIATKALADDMFTLSDDVIYNGAAQYPTITAKDEITVDEVVKNILTDDDYTIEIKDGEGNVVAADKLINADTYTFTFTATDEGNYTGSAEQEFTISPIEIIAEAVSTSKVYNGLAGLELREGEKYANDATEIEVKFGGLLPDDGDAITVGEGAITIKDAKKDVGSYDIVIDPAKFESTNYTVIAATEAKFTITAAPLTISWNDEYELAEGEFTKVYGAAEPTLTATADNLKIEGAGEGDDIIGNVVITRAEGDAVGSYAIELSAKEGATVFSNYAPITFNGAEDIFTITPASIKVSIAALEVTYTGEPAVVPAFTAEDLVITGLQNGDSNAAVFSTLPTATIAENDGTIGDYQVTLSGGVSDNYIIGEKDYLPSFVTVVPFDLSEAEVEIATQQAAVGDKAEDIEKVATFTISGLAKAADAAGFKVAVANDFVDADGEIKLGADYTKGLVLVANDEGEDGNEIAYNYTGWENAFFGKLIVEGGETLVLDDSAPISLDESAGLVNVTFSARNINANSWNVLVLPFAVTPAQISDAFGYAAVDILNENNDIDGEVHFNLTTSGEIKAYTPFVFKPGEPVEGDQVKNFTDVTFKGVQVEALNKDNEANLIKTDKAENQFIGVLEETTLTGVQYWYMSGGKWYDCLDYTVTLKPLRAYVEIANPVAGARIFIEEADGTVTAIDAISFSKAANEGVYNLNGVKVNNANRKGVFIQNGKKVINK